MRRIAAALFVAVAFSGGAKAQAWPEKPVRFVVGFTPGGPSDIPAPPPPPTLPHLPPQPALTHTPPPPAGHPPPHLPPHSAPARPPCLLPTHTILPANRTLHT